MKVGLFPGQGVQPSLVLEVLSPRHKLLTRANEILEMDLRKRVEIAARGSAAALPHVAGATGHLRFQHDRLGGGPAHRCAVLRAQLGRVRRSGCCGCRWTSTTRCRRSGREGWRCRMPAAGSLVGWPPCWASSLSIVSDIAAQAGVSVANDNAPGQVVLSGSDAGLTKAAGMVVAAGGRSVLLDVASAFHTVAMVPAVEPFRRALELCEFTMPSAPVISNVTARPYTSTDEIRSLLLDQLTGSIHFRGSLEWLWSKGGSRLSGLQSAVVAGLCKRTFRALETSRAAVYA